MHAPCPIHLDIPATLLAYRDAAIIRLGYLFPGWALALTPDGISARQSMDLPEAEMRREILFAIYREKILAETLPMRRALLEAVTRP